jgi:hypothetical protein
MSKSMGVDAARVPYRYASIGSFKLRVTHITMPTMANHLRGQTAPIHKGIL